MNGIGRLVPGVFLLASGVASIAVGTPRPTALQRPLATSVETSFMGVQGTDRVIDPEEVKGSGVTNYLMRSWELGIPEGQVELYVGYHATQQGQYHMHSPEVCLPGSGWLPDGSSVVSVPVGGAPVQLNRYTLRKGNARILVYYWFQGRGRVSPGWTKFGVGSFVDGLKYHRDEEALVRIIVPLGSHPVSEPLGKVSMPADSIALRLAAESIPELHKAFPSKPA